MTTPNAINSLSAVLRQAYRIVRDQKSTNNSPERQYRFRLLDAKEQLAKAQGYDDWASLQRAITDNSGEDLQRHHLFERQASYYRDRAHGLVSMWQAKDRRAINIIRNHFPPLNAASDQEILDYLFDTESACEVYASEHGFTDWASMESYLSKLDEKDFAGPFMQAFEAIRDNNMGVLKDLLDAFPELPNFRGTNGNSLLNLAGFFKQREMLQLLIERGGDLDLANNKGWTPLHQASMRSPETGLMDLLLQHGANPQAEAYGSGGTPMACALFHGYHHAASHLAKYGVFPKNLRIAAGVGDISLVDTFFDGQGNLLPAAGRYREFHRIHSGYRPWQFSDSPQEILDEALVYAARNQQFDVLPILLKNGADVNGAPYLGAALHYANTDISRWLLERGADPNVRDHAGATPLHYAAGDANLEKVEALLAAGADVNLREKGHDGSPVGWADYAGHKEVVALLLENESNLDLLNALEFNKLSHAQSLLNRGELEAYAQEYKDLALRIVAYNGHLALARQLLNMGSNPGAPAWNGKNALEYATMQDHKEMVDLLASH